MTRTHQARLDMLEKLWAVAYAKVEGPDNNSLESPEPNMVMDEFRELLRVTGWELDAVRIQDVPAEPTPIRSKSTQARG